MLAQRKPANRLKDEDQVLGFAYVDDRGLLGLRQGEIDRLHQKYGETVEDRGLEMHSGKSRGGVLEDVTL